MTREQLTVLDKLIGEKRPGWKVARGGILTTEPKTGKHMIHIMRTGPGEGIPSKVLCVNFDTMTILDYFQDKESES